MIVKISDVLNVSLDQLLKGDEELVQQISEDTTVRKTQGKSIRKLKTVIIALAVTIVVLLIAFFFLRNSYHSIGPLSDAEMISTASIGDDDVLHIALNLPKSVEISGYDTGDMTEDNMPNTVGISIELSKDWLANGDLRTSLDIPIYTESSNDYDFLSADYLKQHDIRRIIIFYKELGDNDTSRIHELYSIDLPAEGK